MYSIERLGNGWYDFKTLPQEGRYIQVHCLLSGTDEKAIKTARKIVGDKKAVITIKEAQRETVENA